MPHNPIADDARALYRQTWVSAAMDVLAADGIQGVRVELLARKLKITKGAFYHHFKDRNDLLAAMLEHWRRSMATEIIYELEDISNPRERFHRLMQLPLHDTRIDFDVELAIRLWARGDPGAQAVLEEVDALRLDYLIKVVTECGVPPGKARARAVLTFSFLRAAASLIDETDLLACEQVLLGP